MRVVINLNKQTKHWKACIVQLRELKISQPGRGRKRIETIHSSIILYKSSHQIEIIYCKGF